VKSETFINRRLLVEDAHDVAGSVFYNANPNKHHVRNILTLSTGAKSGT
jgi:hypothetical protein